MGKPRANYIIITEWCVECPQCGEPYEGHLGDPRTVEWIYCEECGQQYEIHPETPFYFGER